MKNKHWLIQSHIFTIVGGYLKPDLPVFYNDFIAARDYIINNRCTVIHMSEKEKTYLDYSWDKDDIIKLKEISWDKDKGILTLGII